MRPEIRFQFSFIRFRNRERLKPAGVHISVTNFDGRRMSQKLDRNVKTALDETRLLVLGVAGGAGSFLALMIMWYAVPLALRIATAKPLSQTRKRSAAA